MHGDSTNGAIEQASDRPAAPVARSTADVHTGARLQSLVEYAASSIDGALAAGVCFDLQKDHTAASSPELAASDEIVRSLHSIEIEDGDGPGWTALRTGEVIRISSTADEGPWEMFREACRSAGIMSTASFPVTVGSDRVGVLNVYSADYHAFDVDAIRAGRQIAVDIGAVLAADQAAAEGTR